VRQSWSPTAQGNFPFAQKLMGQTGDSGIASVPLGSPMPERYFAEFQMASTIAPTYPGYVLGRHNGRHRDAKR
jgi:hypothetical protein